MPLEEDVNSWVSYVLKEKPEQVKVYLNNVERANQDCLEYLGQVCGPLARKAVV